MPHSTHQRVNGALRLMNLTGRRVSSKLGPYVAVALLVPGGSLIALSMWALLRPAGSTNRSRAGAITRTALKALIVATPLLASCASSGLYNMSDQWCARHADATAAQCPGSQELASRSASRD